MGKIGAPTKEALKFAISSAIGTKYHNLEDDVDPESATMLDDLQALIVNQVTCPDTGNPTYNCVTASDERDKNASQGHLLSNAKGQMLMHFRGRPDLLKSWIGGRGD